MVICIYDDEGNLLGKYNPNNAKWIAGNAFSNGDVADIYRTSKGNLIYIYRVNRPIEHKLITKEKVIEYMEKWGYLENDIQGIFPDYVPEETL